MEEHKTNLTAWEKLTTEKVVKMPVLQGGKTIFDAIPKCTFKVPIYQRAFAWGTPPREVNGNEIICLMDDIRDAAGSAEYYIGNAVVKAVDGSMECEVIDGQQRLTALLVLLNCLDGVEIKAGCPLVYECRDRSTNTLKFMRDVVAYAHSIVGKTDVDATGKVKRFEDGSWSTDQGVMLEQSICEGVVSVLRKLHKEGSGYVQRLLEGLEKVKMYIVNVPPNTDLNRYFEVMNTRGEQLEPQDIVKAKIMRMFTDVAQRDLFACIWNACGDMNGYVQMHFEPGLRKRLFGENWAELRDLDDVVGEAVQLCEPMSICYAILHPEGEQAKTEVEDAPGEEVEQVGEPSRFRSVIPFPYFLLNVLKVFNFSRRIERAMDGELDQAKMIERFEKLFRNDEEEGAKEYNAETAWGFAQCLLKCRYLFDRYLIKRDYEHDSVDGEWSLKELKENQSSAQYVLSTPTNLGGDDMADLREEMLMLQSCLRVTYTEFKGMHWITKALNWLYQATEGIDFNAYVQALEVVAGTAAREDVNRMEGCGFRMGTLTPHLVLNYLDYLLWKDAKAKKKFVKDGGIWQPFVFAYRNSVEHWYPQHPENLDAWEDFDASGRRAVDQFGNLCLVQPSENSKFSNLRPSAKKEQYGDVISNGSLKLRLMAEKTETQWRDYCEQHGNEMLEMLRTAFRRVLGNDKV